MYKLLLISKYLMKRRIAWIALMAVALCTTMVITVISVMGGWLRNYEKSFKSLSGDILVVAQAQSGFTHYEEMMAALANDDRVESTVPLIESPGLMVIQRTNLKQLQVMVLGVRAEDISKIPQLRQAMYRQYQRPIAEGRPPQAAGFDLINGIDYPERYRQAFIERFIGDPKSRAGKLKRKAAEEVAESSKDWPGLIVGSRVVGIARDSSGKVAGRSEVMYRVPVTVSVLGIAPSATTFDLADKGQRSYWIVDDARTKNFFYDNHYIFVPFDLLQQDLRMNEYEYSLTSDPDRLLKARARISQLHINLKPGVDLETGREATIAALEKAYPGLQRTPTDDWPVKVQTWREKHAKFLGAVEKEKVLVLVLFAIISAVAVLLVFCIFFMVVQDKTRDIGIIKSVGATPGGVAAIFMGYGLTLGIIGSAIGYGLSLLIVTNINEIHTWLGQAMGVKVWDPSIYVFEDIPNRIDPVEVTVIVLVSVFACVLGAVIPAIRAACMNPVDAVRWE